jgi:hypothetical protein
VRKQEEQKIKMTKELVERLKAEKTVAQQVPCYTYL